MDKKIVIVIVCIAICFCVALICDTYKSTRVNTNENIELKLDSLKQLIENNNNSIVVYKDMMKNEVTQIDYISNDSAIILFRELVNEPSLHGEFSKR